jgi:FkbM family methyltransferase
MMPMEHRVRQWAQKALPHALRKPLGKASAYALYHWVYPVQGLLFDLSGGRFRTDGCVFEIPRHLTTLGYRASFWSNTYEAEERQLIRQFLKPSDQVLELGACLGIVSCVTNRLLSDKSRHVVVEANPNVIPSLYRNRALNNAGFLIEHCAVSNKSEETFYLHPVYIVGGTSQRATETPVRLPGRSWRDLDVRYGPFSTLVIDIEGSELQVFEASADLLQRYRLVVAELHPWAIGEDGVQRCRDLMQSAGLKFRGRVGITEAWERDSSGA